MNEIHKSININGFSAMESTIEEMKMQHQKKGK